MVASCKICDKVFSSQPCVNRHIKTSHYFENVISYQYNMFNAKCFTCMCSFKFTKDLREHLVKEHNFPLEIEEITFNNIEDFEIWLQETCKNEKVNYVLTRGSKIFKSDDGESCVSYYNCNRSIKKYSKSINEESRKRTIKSQGSSKLDFTCTSQIKLTQMKGNCSVVYYKTHYKHEKDIEHLRLLKLDKQEIANQLLAGVSVGKILDQNKDHNDDSDIQRIHLLTRKDVSNIRSSYGIDCKKNGKHTVHIDKIITRHRTAIKSSFKINFISKGEFTVSDNGNTYEVKKVNNTCCELLCKICSICIHTFQCTCTDYYLNSTICKHIHYVALNFRSLQIVTENQDIKMEEIHLHLETEETNDVELDCTIDMQEKVKNTANSIIEMTKQCTNNEVLQACYNFLNKAASVLDLEINAALTENTGEQKPIIEKIDEIQLSSTNRKNRNTFIKKSYHSEQEYLNNEPYISRDRNNDHSYLNENFYNL